MEPVLIQQTKNFEHNLGGDKIQKENHKKHRLHDSFKFYYPTLAEVYSQQNLIQFLLY